MRCNTLSPTMSGREIEDKNIEQVDRKRKGESFDELEIDLNASVPLSKTKAFSQEGKIGGRASSKGNNGAGI